MAYYGDPATVQDCALYTCDGCESTVLASDRELTQKWNWKRYASGKLLLCPDCQPKSGTKPA